MNFLFCCRNNNNFCIVRKLKQEGHRVQILCTNPSFSDYESPEQALSVYLKIDYVVFDGPGLGKLGKWFEDKGTIVYNSSNFNDWLSNDVEFSTSILKRGCRNLVPTIYTLGSAEAADFLMSNDKENEFEWSLNDEDPLPTETLIAELPASTPMLIQQRYPVFSEFDLICFFGTHGMVSPLLVMEEGFGLLPRGGRQSSETCYLWPLPDKHVVYGMLEGLDAVLGAVRYTGPVRVRVVVRGSCRNPEVLVQSVSTTLPDAFWPAFCQLVDGLADFFLSGKMVVSREVAAAVRISVAPYPFSETTEQIKQTPELSCLINEPVNFNEDEQVYYSSNLGFHTTKYPAPYYVIGADVNLATFFEKALAKTKELQCKMYGPKNLIYDHYFFGLTTREEEIKHGSIVHHGQCQPEPREQLSGAQVPDSPDPRASSAGSEGSECVPEDCGVGSRG